MLRTLAIITLFLGSTGCALWKKPATQVIFQRVEIPVPIPCPEPPLLPEPVLIVPTSGPFTDPAAFVRALLADIVALRAWGRQQEEALRPYRQTRKGGQQ